MGTVVGETDREMEGVVLGEGLGERRNQLASACAWSSSELEGEESMIF